MRQSITVDVRGCEYAGEYEVEGSTLLVFFRGKDKTAPLNSPYSEIQARLLLIELISGL